jgi:predicted metal-dependent hydrolase
MDHITYGSTKIYYTLQESKKRKTLSISVDQSGVNVVSPVHTPIAKIEEILHQKAPWIKKQLADFEEMKTSVKPKHFLSGEKLPYLGRHYRLKVSKVEGTIPSFRFHQGRFVASVPNNTEEAEYRKLLRPLYLEWIKEKSYRYTLDRISRFTIKIQREPVSISIKEQQQRWGTCTPEGKLLLNWRVFLAPTSIIDYVLAHELAHLVHLNHSKEYWETVRLLLPDYEDRKEWLRLHGGTLDV